MPASAAANVSHPECSLHSHVGEQIARALGAAQTRGIVHCDIKPENLMVRQDGFVKVMDFGLARDITSLTASSILPAGNTGEEIVDGAPG